MELQALKALSSDFFTAFINELAVCHGNIIDRVIDRRSRHRCLTGAQTLYAVVFLAEVSEVEVGYKRPHQKGGFSDRKIINL